MRNIWITVSYDGTEYAGFQRQENGFTVQEALEKVLKKLTGVHTTIYFVARTDAGVHAYGQECTFYTESSIPSERFKNAMNSLLPCDIRVLKSKEMYEDFSVRKTNYGKTYAYILSEDKDINPFLRKYVWYTGRKLDLQKMKEVAKVLEGKHDFTSFRGNNSVPADPVRFINEVRIIRKKSLIFVYVTGEGFLYHMVRNMVGAFVDAGRGIMTPERIKEILKAKDRKKLGITAPPQGLALLKVYFEPISHESINEILNTSYYPWTCL